MNSFLPDLGVSRDNGPSTRGLIGHKWFASQCAVIVDVAKGRFDLGTSTRARPNNRLRRTPPGAIMMRRR
jgi:hypothetical protein